MNQDQIFPIVRACIAESLAIDETEIKLESRLIDDLNADSLDFLDILFGLEKEFSTKLRDPNLDLLVRADFSPEKTNGTISPEILQRLSVWLPELKNVSKPDQLVIRNIYSFITVETLVRLVQNKLFSEPG